MGSLSFGEIATILVVVLVIFGPDRLPELARRIGGWIARAREATASFTRQMEAEYGEAAKPIDDLRTQIEGARRDITSAVAGIVGADEVPEPSPDPTPDPTPDDPEPTSEEDA